MKKLNTKKVVKNLKFRVKMKDGTTRFFFLSNIIKVIYFYIVFLSEFIGMTFVCKTIQVSSVQVNKISSSHCIVHQLPQDKSLSPTSTNSHLPFPSAYQYTVFCVCILCIYVFWLITSPSFIQFP